MAINPILPILIGAIKTRNTIKDRNDDAYDEATGNFIDIASAEFFRDQTEQKKRIEKNNKFYNATEGRYGTNVAEFVAKNNLFDGYDKITAFLSDIEGGTVIPVGLRNKLRSKEGFKEQAFKTTFAEDQTLAKKKLENKATFAAQNLNKGAISNLADLYLKDTGAPKPEERGPVSSFLFGKEAPSTTSLVGGFEKGLEQAEEKAVTDIKTDGSADAQELAQDTEIVTKKIGFEAPISIGSVREVDSAIASVLNVKDIQITNEGIIFPKAFKLRALAIKDIAAQLKQTGNYPDVTSLINAAASKFEREHFSKLPVAFNDYKVKSSITDPVNVTATGLKDPNSDNMMLGPGWMKVFGNFADNPDTEVKETLTYVDQILKPRRETGGTELMMSKNAYDAIKNYVQRMDSAAEQKAFIEYLPNNFLVPIGPNEVPMRIRDTLFQTFGFTRI
tara:strand:+ start:479 stop:1819 length:1341 start_codon:yes stop_codon:yes gene_type:complete